MCSVAAAGIIMAAGSAIAGGVQSYRNLDSAQKAAEENARRMQQARADAQFRGGAAAGQVAREYSQVEAQQQATMASSGFSLDSGSYLDILAGTRGAKSYEQANALANAAREALGYQREADDYQAQAAQLKKEKTWAVASTLVGGSSQVADGIDKLKRREN